MTRKGIKLVAPDNNGILCYQGNCKLKINTLSKMLKVEPKHEAFNDISALFQWKFIQKRNLMFVFSENVIQDFVLVFANDEICTKVHDKIYKNREEDSIEKEELQQRLLIQIFQLFSKNATRFKKAMLEWIEKHEENEKKEFLELLKVHENNHQILDVKNIKQEPNTSIARKRRFYEIDNADKNENNGSMNNSLNDVKCKEVQPKKNTFTRELQIIDESRFKIVNLKSQNVFNRRLLIFTSTKKTECYEYKFHLKKQTFYHTCNRYVNGMKAILKVDENGNECIKYENKKHVCSPLLYDPQRYVELKIIKKPNYEIMENCSTKSKRMLIIFNPEDRSQCYEYYWYSKQNKFICCGCSTKHKHLVAEIVHENTESEYIRLLSNQHFCEIRNYNPAKFNQIKKYVLSPNFKIQTKFKDGIERNTLIIFYEKDRKLCYSYHYELRTKLFNCNGCFAKRKTVSAKICQNNDGDDYVILSNFEHICSPKQYFPQQNEIILRPPNIKFMESNVNHKSKLFIFNSNDPNLCYTFSSRHGENFKRWLCLGCLYVTKSEKRSPTINCESKRIVCVDLRKNDGSNGDDGEYYVKMLDGQKHICVPQKYEPEKYERKILKPKEDYILLREKRKKKSLHGLVIYLPNDKTLCYMFNVYKSTRKQFQCSMCEKKGSSIIATLRQDSNGNENLISSYMQHVCQPIKVSSVIKSDIVIIEKSCFTFKKSKKKEIDEIRIVRLPDFELQRNIKGVPERKLIVFASSTRNYCYEYRYENYRFLCNKCQITAKLHSENDEKYVILGPNEHKCEPVKFEPEKKIIESSDYLIFNRDDNSKPTKLIIFTSPKKTDCYEYTFIQQKKSFQCCGCYSNGKKNVCAKLMKDDSNEKEYIQYLKNEHICTPKKFVLEEFQPKTVSESGFKICSNKNGRLNSKLIVFDSEKDGFGYEYSLEKLTLFLCIQCKGKKKRVTAKVCEKENGEKYLELSKEKHICKSTKYDSKK